MTFFDKVKQLADARKMPMAEIERKLDISENASYKWKKSTPKGEIVKKLADLFNVTTDYLYDREDENKDSEFIQFFRSETEGLSDDEKEAMVVAVKDFLEFRKSQILKKRK